MLRYYNSVLIDRTTQLERAAFGTRVLTTTTLMINGDLYDRKTLKKINICFTAKEDKYRFSRDDRHGFYPYFNTQAGLYSLNISGKHLLNDIEGTIQSGQSYIYAENNKPFETYWWDPNNLQSVFIGSYFNEDNTDTTSMDLFDTTNGTISNRIGLYNYTLKGSLIPIADSGDDIIFLPNSTLPTLYDSYPYKYNKKTKQVTRLSSYPFYKYIKNIIDIDNNNTQLTAFRTNISNSVRLVTWDYVNNTYTTTDDIPFIIDTTKTILPDIGLYSIQYSQYFHFSNTFFDSTTGLLSIFKTMMFRNAYGAMKYFIYKIPIMINTLPEGSSIIEPIMMEVLDDNNYMYYVIVDETGTHMKVYDNKLQIFFIGERYTSTHIKTYSIIGNQLQLISNQTLEPNTSTYHEEITSKSIEFLNTETYDEIVIYYGYRDGGVGDSYAEGFFIKYKRDENGMFYETHNRRHYSSVILDKQNKRMIGVSRYVGLENIGFEYIKTSKIFIDSYEDLKIHPLYQINENDLIYEGVDKEIIIKFAAHIDNTKIKCNMILEIDTIGESYFTNTNSKYINVSTLDDSYVNISITLTDSNNIKINEYKNKG